MGVEMPKDESNNTAEFATKLGDVGGPREGG